MSTAIHVEGLGKRYQIGATHTRHAHIGDQFAHSIRTQWQSLRSGWRRSGSRNAQDERTYWAVRNLNFDIQHGEVVGVIGHNGAGKSTLLKLLSRITEPSEGYADIYGRVSSLLEVGTGFHPELTGRENIFLNGAILGMKRSEINEKFDEIVEFAEIGKFLGTPVKHYSSGMYVRLAFSVAAHLEPEILLVDEVLAVGDVAFQKKCLGKMDSVARQGRTILFVSHNMNALQRLCANSILLEHGQLVAYGPTPQIIEKYLATAGEENQPDQWIEVAAERREGSGKARFAALSYSSNTPATGNQPFPGGPLEIALDIVTDTPRTVSSIAATLYDRYGTKLVNADSLAFGEPIALDQGHTLLRFQIQSLHLNPGIYTLGLWMADPPAEVYDSVPSATLIEVAEVETNNIRVQSDGLVTCDFKIARAQA